MPSIKIGRINHLTLGHAVKRMLAGRFTVPAIMDAAGLSRGTAYELVHTFAHLDLIAMCGKEADKTGRKRIQQFEINAAALSARLGTMYITGATS